MKYLKKFNERLSPETYKEAGKKLKKMSKKDRGDKLINYYHELTSGFYDVIISFDTKLKITDPTLEFKYGFFQGDMGEFYKDAEELVGSWLEGDVQLGFSIVVNFKNKSGSDRYDSSFVLSFLLNDNTLGFDKDLYNDIEEFYYDKPPNFQEISDPMLFLEGHFFDNNYDSRQIGFFVNRKSALKFKKLIIKEIKKFTNNIKDILEIVYADVDELEKILNSINDIRINSIYQDENNYDETLRFEPINIK